MDILETHHYLVRARRDLWAALEAVPNGTWAHPTRESLPPESLQGMRASGTQLGRSFAAT